MILTIITDMILDMIMTLLVNAGADSVKVQMFKQMVLNNNLE